MGRLPAEEKVARDRDLCRDRARGMTWAKLAERHDLDPRTARRIWSAFAERERPKLTERDPIEVVWTMAERYEAWIEQAAEIALVTEHDSVRIGALNTQARMQEKQSELLMSAGILPRDLGRLRVEMDVRYIIAQVIKVFRKHGVAEEAQAEIVALVQGSANQN